MYTQLKKSPSHYLCFPACVSLSTSHHHNDCGVLSWYDCNYSSTAVEGTQCGACKVASSLYNKDTPQTTTKETECASLISKYCFRVCKYFCSATSWMHIITLLRSFYLSLSVLHSSSFYSHCYSCLFTPSLSSKSYLTGMLWDSPTLPLGYYPVSDLSRHCKLLSGAHSPISGRGVAETEENVHTSELFACHLEMHTEAE